MSNRIAPNGNYWRYEYAGLDGVYKPMPVTAAGRITTVMAELTDQVIRGQTIGAVFTNQPLPTGSFTVLDIQPTPTSYTMHDEIVDGAGGFTGTNNTLTNAVDTTIRLVSIRATCDLRPIQGVAFYLVWSGVRCMFSPSPAEQDSGSTWEITTTCYGGVASPVYL